MTKQQEKVYRSILESPDGITSKEIMMKTGIQCPSGRISELRAAGVEIISVGQVKYDGSKAFEKYAITNPLMKKKREYYHNPYTNLVEERIIEVPV